MARGRRRWQRYKTLTGSLVRFFCVSVVRSDALVHVAFSPSCRPARCTTSLPAQPDPVAGDQSRKYATLPRLYVGPAIFADKPTSSPNLDKGVKLSLSPDQSHYLLNVMRIFGRGGTKSGAGDHIHNEHCIRIFDGKSGEWLARISMPVGGNDGQDAGEKQRQRRRRQRDTPSNLCAECVVRLRGQDERRQPWLLFAPIKKQRAKLMIEKCTELGAGLFIPIISDRTDQGAVRGCLGSSSSSDGLDKLALQALEAAEQCERLTVPRIIPTLSESDGDVWNVDTLLQNWCCEKSVGDRRILMICRERDGGGAVLPRLADIATNGTGVAFLIGPEGGWTKREKMLFDKYCSRSHLVQSVSLGKSVLRAETAAIMAVGAWALDDDSRLE